jgi:phenylacetate-coenzyme A ligase PaaK-like adenylate-forming protein
LALFRFQATHCQVYNAYLSALSIDKNQVKKLANVPFLPIEFFKTHQVLSANAPIEAVFESSGTTGSEHSKHYVSDTQFYKNVSISIFEQTYGKISDYHFFALLPSYLERNNSSLVYMVKHFKENAAPTDTKNGGFYLNHTQDLAQDLKKIQAKKQKSVLIGVTFALLDFAEQNPMDLSDVIIMETGGMKGRRRELIREEVHDLLKETFGVAHIHSEYGMTELLSQAYSKQNGIFQLPFSMKVLLRDMNDPLEVGTHLKSGGINVIDLANVDSCAFIETKDLGILIDNEHFKVLGRYDNADVRGCSQLVV